MFLLFILANFYFSIFYISSNPNKLDFTEEKNSMFYLSNSTVSFSEVKGITDNINTIIDSNNSKIERLNVQENHTEEEYNLESFHGDPLSVIGSDDRVHITPTTISPWQTIVKLYITWGADTYIGSGVMIDKNHVLTAGHCVYDIFLGGWADSIKIIPGMDNGNEPYGHAWATDMRCYLDWRSFHNHQHDFAVLTLDSDIGLQTGWMELYTSNASSSVYTGDLNVAGYPADLDYGLNMYWDYDVGRYANEYNHWYYLDTTGGMSGSPVWIFDGVNQYVISVCAYSDDGSGSNHGTRIDRNKFDCINNWLLADETSTDKPDFADRGDAYCGFNTTLVGAGLTDFEVWCEVQNLGTHWSGLSTVSYFASDDVIITQDDYLIGQDSISPILSTYYDDSNWAGLFPANIPTGTYYIGWIIDPDDSNDEFNENNNWNYVEDTTLFVDAIPPSNPNLCLQLNVSTENNVWQDTINDPYFNWSGAQDSHTNISGYYFYWGDDPNGTSSNFTTFPVFNPPRVETGSYYLRVRTEDTVGNYASWTTLYIFKYNESLNDIPDNPDDPDTKLRYNDDSSNGGLDSGSDDSSDSLLNQITLFGLYITIGILSAIILFQIRNRMIFKSTWSFQKREHFFSKISKQDAHEDLEELIERIHLKETNSRKVN